MTRSPTIVTASSCAPTTRPEPLIAELAAAGARLISVAPLKATLEDVFMARVGTSTTASGTQNPSMLRRIRLVAWHVFKESVRDRVLYSIVAFAVLLVAASLLIGQITAGQDVKIIKDLGLATIELAGVLMTVFIGVGLVLDEIDRRSIYSLLAKPLPRWEFIVGKYSAWC